MATTPPLIDWDALEEWGGHVHKSAHGDVAGEHPQEDES